MGLPLFVIPADPEQAAKSTDKSAAHSRSAIRRQRTVRRLNHQLRPEEGRIRIPYEGSSTPILPDHIPDLLSPTDEAELEAAHARLAAARRLHDAVNGLPSNTFLGRGDVHRVSRGSRGSALLPLQQRAEASQAPQAGTSSSGPPMPPVPESRDFQVSRRPVASTRRSRNRSWAEYRRGILESHPTPSGLANGSGIQMLPPTPNFSPVRRYTLEESRDRPRSDSPPSLPYYSSYLTDTEQLSSLPRVRSPSTELRSLRDLPPFRRIGRRSIADIEARRLRARVPRLDGLGDRDRSLSPDGDGAWETMQTTLTPDPQLPSAGSSFASVSTATSASSNAESSATSLNNTDNSQHPTDLVNAAIENACDLLEDTEDSSLMSDTDLEDEDDLYGLRGDARNSIWLSYTDAVASQADRRGRYHRADTLGGMQRIVRGLARREDIPDEWWAEAGLSRNFPRETIRL